MASVRVARLRMVRGVPSLIDSFFPPQLRQALVLLVRHRLIEPERKMGPFLRDAIVKAKGSTQDLYDRFSIQVPLREAAGLLTAIEALHCRLRLSVDESNPHLDRLLASRDVVGVVQAAFEELSRTE